MAPLFEEEESVGETFTKGDESLRRAFGIDFSVFSAMFPILKKVLVLNMGWT